MIKQHNEQKNKNKNKNIKHIDISDTIKDKELRKIYKQIISTNCGNIKSPKIIEMFDNINEIYNNLPFVSFSKSNSKSNQNSKSNSKIHVSITKNKKNSGTKSLSFMSNNIKENIKKFMYKYTIIYSNITINYIKPVKSLTTNDKRLLIKCIKRIMTIREYKNRHSSKLRYYKKNENNTDSVFVTIYPTSLKKKLPKTRDIQLSPEHVNSGATTVYSDASINGHIYIWRSEELLKVLTHELIHSLNIDNKLIFDEEHRCKNKKLLELLCVDPKQKDYLTFNEAYTESVALILSSMFVSLEMIEYLEYSKSMQKMVDCGNIKSVELFGHILDVEKEFSICQIHKILNFYRYDTINDLLRTNSCKIFRQETNVISYYIIKTIFVLNIDKNGDNQNTNRNGNMNMNMNVNMNTNINTIPKCSIIVNNDGLRMSLM